MTDLRTWTLDLPDMPYVSPNKRGHWTDRSRANAEWRRAAHLLARTDGVPPCRRIRVALDYWPPTRHRRDPDNLVPGVLKPIVDGLVDANVVIDDTAEFIERTFPTIHQPRDDRRPIWRLTIVELEAAGG